MTDAILEQYRRTLALYSEDLLQETIKRLPKPSRAKKSLTSAELLEASLAPGKAIEKLIAEFSEPHQRALALFHRSPSVYWRWDHAVRFLVACDIPSPYRVLQELLAAGLLCMRPPRGSEPLVRFEIGDGLPLLALPTIALAGPLAQQKLELAETFPPLRGVEAPSGNWRECDGWELPVRLAVLWRIAQRAPIKRTQQNVLFKRDQERIQGDPLLGSAMLDAPSVIEESGMLVHALAARQGWLSEGDEQSPTALLEQVWPESLDDLLLFCARELLQIEAWNEFGKKTPPGPFATEVASARFLLLLGLASLPEDKATTVEELASRLELVHAPWNAQGELVGPFRQAPNRAKLARDWVRACVLGPFYQCGLVSLRSVGKDEPLLRLTALGRVFLGETVQLPARTRFPQTMLAQPNHELIVYRQGLCVPLLGKLVLFAEPKSMGAALAFEINADSVYHGLESGMGDEEIISLVREYSGRDLPSGLAESIRTWAQKRDRLTVYSDVSIFEFSDEKDLHEALARGLEGTQIAERLIIVTGDQERNFKNLKITASRDYRFAQDQCVETGGDGITLKVDLEKSDLMLESELRRFADPMAYKDRAGRQQFRVTADSLARAFQQGLRIDNVEEWYRQRTGNSPPPSVQLLFRAAAGFRLKASHVIMVGVESPLVAEGLLQHPETAEFFGERLGPSALAVPEENLVPLRAALDRLGIELEILDDVPSLAADVSDEG